MRVPIQIHGSLCNSLRSRIFFTHRAVVATSAQCFGIGTRIHYEQLREDCFSLYEAAGIEKELLKAAPNMRTITINISISKH